MKRPLRSHPVIWAAVAGLLALHPGAAGAEPVRIGAAGVTGLYYALGSAFCRLLEPALFERLRQCDVRSTQGSLSNVRFVRSRIVDFGIAQAPVIAEAFTGTGAFTVDRANPNLRVLFSTVIESLVIVVRANADIERLEDLRGRRIDLGPPASGSRATALRLVEAAEIDEGAFTDLASPTSAVSSDALCRGQSDAFVFVGAHPNSIVQDALAGCPTRLLTLEGPILERFLASHPDYRRLEIGPDEYPGLDGPVTTVGMPAFIVADAGLPDEIAHRLTRTVFENLDQLQRLHIAFVGLDREALLLRCPGVPFHPGALAYFAEAGIAPPPCS